VLVECLSNVTPHAQAHVVLLDLKVDRDEGIVLVVADDGIGYNTATRESGLHNMRDRAEMFGGKCEVGSKLGLGTRVKWRVPARSIQSDG
jgi:signal transduction histidine kinase